MDTVLAVEANEGHWYLEVKINSGTAEKAS